MVFLVSPTNCEAWIKQEIQPFPSPGVHSPAKQHSRSFLGKGTGCPCGRSPRSLLSQDSVWSVVSNLYFFFFFFSPFFFFFLLNLPGKSTPVSQLGSADFPDSPDPFQPLGADSSDPFQNKRGFGDPFSGKDPFAPSSSAKPSKASSLGFADFTSVS